MIKLLNKSTGNVFTLPDEDALKIKEQDIAQEFQILDAGYQERTEEKVSEKTVEELVLRAEERKAEIENEDNKVEEEPVIKVPKTKPKITEDTLNLEKLSKLELCAVAQRLGKPANHNDTKKEIIARIRETGVIK